MSVHREIAATAQEIKAGVRLFTGLGPYVRRPITLPEARAALDKRLAQRELTFLSLLRGSVYGRDASPYRQLLQLAGCEYGDAERLVWQDGIECAMKVLHRSGVYLTMDEFKGRRPVVRGSATLQVYPTLLRNPRASVDVPAQTGGSSGPSTPLGFNLRFLRETGGNHLLGLQARGGLDWTHAIWTVPGGNALASMGPFLLAGIRYAHWFSLLDPSAPDIHARYRWSTRLLRWGSLLGGVDIPQPSYAPMEHPLAIATWLGAVVRNGRTPHLFTSTSAAVRLSQAAVESGIDLKGAELTVGGEPVTEDCLAEIAASGARAAPRYAATDYGTLGYPCCAPQAADEVHVPRDRVAVIRPEEDAHVSGLPPTDLLFTSLSAWSTVVLLNVSLGDQATLSERCCGCPLHQLGWATHLHTIRSHEKLTAGGMTFLDAEVVRVLEHVLPQRFGGGPTHYQLVDDVGTEGQPRLWLRVHPDLGPLDPNVITEAFLTEIGHGSGAQHIMSQVWRDGRFLQVVRKPPQATELGKVLHVQSARVSSR